MKRSPSLLPWVVCLPLLAYACGDDESANGQVGVGPEGGPTDPNAEGGTATGEGGLTVTPEAGPTVPPAAACAAAGGGTSVSAPTILLKLKDDGGEAWLASPAVVDIDDDKQNDVVIARGTRVLAFKSNGQKIFSFDTTKDRIWASPAIGNFTGDAKLEIAIAARDSAFLINAAGAALPGFPVIWGTSETRTLAAGDIDGDGALDLAVGVENEGTSTDVVRAYSATGATLAGFPPVASGASGCTNTCYLAGLYDQNLAIGDLDGDAKQDLVLPHDNAYASFFKGTGAAFDSNAMYNGRPKTPGVRYCHLLSDAKQGYPATPTTNNQAHFTNTPPAIADIDGDGKYDIVMAGSVQNGAQTDRLRGVGLWVVKPDASRVTGWDPPFHAPDYVLGLNDGWAVQFEGPELQTAANLVGLTNQVTVADIDSNHKGPELLFAGYDGKIHAVGADKTELWATPYATDGRALTGGLVVADLSADGVPEIVFTTYSPDQGGGSLFVLGAGGNQLHKIALPKRGSMAVPAVGDVNGDGTLEIVVSMKDAEAANESTHVFTVAGSKTNCVLWATGRANLLRNGWVR